MEKSQSLILTQEVRQFLDDLHREFNPRRLELLEERKKIQEALDAGWNPEFPAETVDIRNDRSWRGAPIPQDMSKRWVEITGPVEKKMMINALNSGADVFMADFEDALSPTWKNVIEGQANLMEAVRGALSFISPEGKKYALNPKIALLFVRPRGWHLEEGHYQIDGEAISASLFDFGIYFFHNAKELLAKGTGPYFYLPKLENRHEAALWRDVFAFAEKNMQLSSPVIKATVLIETILAAFEMEEIIYELKDYCIGLNAGRWDYIFSIIKKFSARKEFVFPDRSQITMMVPFMRAYTGHLIHTCHKRGIFAMGGMSAFVPSRKDIAVNEQALEAVKKDKLREIAEGFDGTWVAHPDLVVLARALFQSGLQGRQHQMEKPGVPLQEAHALLNFSISHGTITSEGIQKNISVALHYLSAWLKGQGAVTLFHLMEDAATAEISRAQLWQWIHHHAHMEEKKELITLDLIKERMQQEYDNDPENLRTAFVILKKLVDDKNFINFLTLEAYPYL